MNVFFGVLLFVFGIVSGILLGTHCFFHWPKDGMIIFDEHPEKTDVTIQLYHEMADISKKSIVIFSVFRKIHY